MDPPKLTPSYFTSTSAQSGGTTRESRIIGVLPRISRTLEYTKWNPSNRSTILRLYFWLTESETWGWRGRAKLCFKSSRWSWFIAVFENHCFRASFQKTISTEGYLGINGEMGVEWPVVPFVQDWRVFQDVGFFVLKPGQSWTKKNDLVIILVFITIITNY